MNVVHCDSQMIQNTVAGQRQVVCPQLAMQQVVHIFYSFRISSFEDAVQLQKSKFGDAVQLNRVHLGMQTIYR